MKYTCIDCRKKVSRQDVLRCRSCFLKSNYTHSAKTRMKISISRLNEKNPNWSGDKVGYHGLHSWVKRNLLKPHLDISDLLALVRIDKKDIIIGIKGIEPVENSQEYPIKDKEVKNNGTHV